ncbi:MAG: phosphatidylglycerophosphatase A [Phycisphaerales bacterium JB038]
MPDRIKDLSVTVGGLGHIRAASGTWGSLPPVILWMVLVLYCLAPRSWQMVVVLLATALLGSLACIAWGKWAEGKYGKKDPGQVVADEVAGQALALLCLQQMTLGFGPEWLSVVAPGVFAFLAFRMFDIIKLPPAAGLQAKPHGWGILIDDLVAGIYANVGTQLGIILLAQPILDRLFA